MKKNCNKSNHFYHFLFILVFYALLLLFYMIDLKYTDISWTTGTLALVIIAFTFCIYSLIIKPYRAYYRYCSQIPQQYNVYVDSFTPLIPNFNFIRRLRKDFQKHGDGFYTTKFQYRKYHLTLTMFKLSINLCLIDSQLIRQFFEKANEGYYIKSQNSLVLASMKSMIGRGLIFSEGNQWKMKRKIMTTVFNYDFIKSKLGTICQIVNQILDKVEKNQENDGKEQIKIDLDSVLPQIFGNVVIKCFFGNIQLGEIRGQKIFTFFSRLNQLNMKRSFSLYALAIGPKFVDLNLRPIDRQVSKLSQQFNSHVYNIIKQHLNTQSINTDEKDQKKNSQSNGVIELLMNSKKLKNQGENSQENKDYYTIQDLIDQFKTFFLAGTDTTSNFSSTLIYQLAKHKQVMQKVRQQIKEVFGDEQSEITFQKLKQLKYLENCQKQTLRMYAPSPGLFNRQATKDHYLGNIPVKVGMTVSIGILSAHHQELLSTRPEIFNPDRWNDIDLNKKPPYLFIPFSSGQRNCIGQHLAMIQNKILVVSIIIIIIIIISHRFPTHFNLQSSLDYCAEGCALLQDQSVCVSACSVDDLRKHYYRQSRCVWLVCWSSHRRIEPSPERYLHQCNKQKHSHSQDQQMR